MSRLVSIHKGLDIRLQGLAEKQLKILPNSRIICISPLDFHGLNPKLLVKEGDSVKVKLIGLDPKTGKFKLSRKALMPKPDFNEGGSGN